MKTRRIATLASATGIATGLGLAAGTSQAGAATVTFEGACKFNAVQIRLNNGIETFQESDFDGTMAGPGTCTGTIAGRRIQERVSTLDLQMAGRGTCAGTAVYAGGGTFRVDGVSVPVTATLTKPTPTVAVVFELRGTVSGTANGNGNGDLPGALALQDPSRGALGCALGEGTRATAVDVPFSTTTPLVSTVSDPPAPPAPVAARLKLSASSQRAATVRRTGAVRARCTVPAAGRCTVSVVRGGRTIAKGSAAGTPGRAVLVRARLTRAGRSVVRRGGPLRVTVRATAGSTSSARTIVLR